MRWIGENDALQHYTEQEDVLCGVFVCMYASYVCFVLYVCLLLCVGLSKAVLMFVIHDNFSPKKPFCPGALSV